MNTKNILKSMVMAAVCLGSIAFASCSDDDDNNSTSTTALKFSKSSVSVTVGEIDTLKVTNGTQPFTVKSSSDAIATVATKNDSIFVTGVAEGTATIVVTDNNKGTGCFSATVKKAEE